MKICLVGHKCGKTSIIQRWIRPSYPIQPERTIAIDMKSLTCNIDESCQTLRIWDCSGEPHYRDMLDRYMFNTNLICVCYDLTNEESWHIAQYWIARIQRLIDGAIVCLIGNKLDLESKRIIKDNDIKEMIKNTPFYMFHCELSALTGENCKDTLRMILREAKRDPDKHVIRTFEKEKNCTIV